MITKKVQKYGDSRIIRVSRDFELGESVILMNENEYRKLLMKNETNWKYYQKSRISKDI